MSMFFPKRDKIDLFPLIGRASLVIVGNVLSPVWWLTAFLLRPYIDLKASVLSDPAMVLTLSAQMKSLGPAVFFGQLLPLLLICIAAGLVYLVVLHRVGSLVARLLSNRQGTAINAG